MEWSFNFARGKSAILDASTKKAINLLGEELNYLPRHPNYLNPHWELPVEETEEKASGANKRKAKKAKKKRGPKIVNIEL